ncbi:hypothetical protein LOK49_LG02G02164 [Camellia lanceoleosa]|uniref:Uncharacterized protein n=1 Tax=Camellia lanceoleosa TaxID=1840588 RepID=A0ACC0IRA8_9ERIC|nr:hypothetical protein LOK49_LG02G02164 [Camellia lanceoleosa]
MVTKQRRVATTQRRWSATVGRYLEMQPETTVDESSENEISRSVLHSRMVENVGRRHKGGDHKTFIPHPFPPATFSIIATPSSPPHRRHPQPPPSSPSPSSSSSSFSSPETLTLDLNLPSSPPTTTVGHVVHLLSPPLLSFSRNLKQDIRIVKAYENPKSSFETFIK